MKKKAQEVIEILKTVYPVAPCALHYDKDYELMIAVRLSAQCTDARVNLVTPALFARYPDLDAFAAAVFERFENPFIDHELLAISLNSVSKWKARVLPSIRDHYARHGTFPKKLTFSFAALLAFYTSPDLQEDGLHAVRSDGTPYIIRDERAVLEFFAANSGLSTAEYADTACGRADFWGEDLRNYEGFTAAVVRYLEAIRCDIGTALRELC